MTIGEAIKKARNKAGLTQKQLAIKLGVSFTLVSQYERGTRNPKPETLDRIATALGMTLETLLDEAFLYEDGENEHYSRMIASIGKSLFSEAKQEETLDALFEIFANSIFYGIEEDVGFSTIDAMKKLNSEGQKKVSAYAIDLTKIPEYQKGFTPPSESGQTQEPPPQPIEEKPTGDAEKKDSEEG